MKPILLFILLSGTLTFCDAPKQITANPDNQAATSGTVGSAKMTTELPKKSDTSVIQRDSIRQDH